MKYYCAFCQCDVEEKFDGTSVCSCEERWTDMVESYPHDWICIDGRNDKPYDTLEEKNL